MSTELFVATFKDNEAAADKVLETAKQLHKDGALEFHDAAVIVKTSEGEVRVNDVRDIDKKSGTVFGAITGGIVGLLGGPVGAVIGAAAGAATGRATAKLADYGVPDDLIKSAESDLQPGSSAIILYVEMRWVNKAIAALEKNGAIVYHETIDGRPITPPHVVSST